MAWKASQSRRVKESGSFARLVPRYYVAVGDVEARCRDHTGGCANAGQAVGSAGGVEAGSSGGFEAKFARGTVRRCCSGAGETTRMAGAALGAVPEGASCTGGELTCYRTSSKDRSAFVVASAVCTRVAGRGADRACRQAGVGGLVKVLISWTLDLTKTCHLLVAW